MGSNFILSKRDFKRLLLGYSILERGFEENKTSKIV